MPEPRFEIRPLGTWDRPITDPRAGKHHPDRGGDTELFRRLTRARDVLLGTVP